MLQYVLLVALFGIGISYAQAKLDGPFGFSDELRAWAKRSTVPDWIQNGLECPYCISFWVTLLGAALIAFNFPLTISAFFLVWLAGYGLTCFGLLYVGV